MGKFSQPRNGATPSREPAAPTATREPESFQEPPARKTRRSNMVLISLCSVAAALLILVILGVWFMTANPFDDGLILNNVTVAGINLGGMTREQAAATLQQAMGSTYTSTDMVVELPDTTLTFTPAETGAKVNVETLVEEAYRYGREGTYAERKQIKEAANSTVHHIALFPHMALNVDYIRAQLEDYGSSFNSSFTQATVEVEGTKPILNAAEEGFDSEAPGQTLVLYMGTPGRKLDIDKLYNQVLDAYSANRFQVTSQMESAEKLPDALDLQALFDQYHSEPVDAVMDKKTFEVTKETYGYTFDLEAARLLMDAARYGDTFRIQLEMTAPNVLGDALSELLFRDVLASYETKHTKDSNRNNNLKLACAAINGLVLDPGEVFNYNQALGKRTAEKGYKPADAYSAGQTVKSLGGGICQVSSTLYYCTLVADLEIVTRQPHSFVSSYMPMGTDATVSWGGPDFRFKNSTNYPLRIEAKVADGYVKIKLIGTDEKDYYIKMESEVLSTQSPTTIYEEYPKDNDKGYKDGQVITTAYIGYTVQTYKCKYDKETDKLIVKEKDQISKYKKRDKVICKIVDDTKPTDPPVEKPVETTPPVTDPPAPPAPTDPPAPPAETTAP